MHITFHPQLRDDRLTLAREGDTLWINGDDLDMTDIPEGATLPQSAVPCEWLASDIDRIDGVLYFTLILPIGQNAPEEACFPAPLEVTEDGPIALPAYEVVVAEPEAEE